MFNGARNIPSHPCSPYLSLCSLLHSLGSVCFLCAGVTLNWAISDREVGQRHPPVWDVPLQRQTLCPQRGWCSPVGTGKCDGITRGCGLL